MKKALPWVLLVIVAVAHIRARYEWGVEHQKVKALQQQVVEWQYESFVAAEARGWVMTAGTVNSARDMTPKILGYALNPCYSTAAGDVNRSGRACPVTISAGSRPAIRIVLAH